MQKSASDPNSRQGRRIRGEAEQDDRSIGPFQLFPPPPPLPPCSPSRPPRRASRPIRKAHFRAATNIEDLGTVLDSRASSPGVAGRSRGPRGHAIRKATRDTGSRCVAKGSPGDGSPRRAAPLRGKRTPRPTANFPRLRVHRPTLTVGSLGKRRLDRRLKDSATPALASAGIRTGLLAD